MFRYLTISYILFENVSNTLQYRVQFSLVSGKKSHQQPGNMEDIFKNCQIALELGTSIPFKEKQKIRKLITDNGGTVSFVLNKKVRHFLENPPGGGGGGGVWILLTCNWWLTFFEGVVAGNLKSVNIYIVLILSGFLLAHVAT